jgi:D-alanyl-lipoteichoic acid acyltransferase DltB (MBOAT superfamily)
MLFNSVDFAIFLPVVFILYWFVVNKNLKLQNLLIVASSYFFYGWWDWRFLGLILFSSIVDYLVGIGLSDQKNQAKRKILFWTSISINLGLLGFFKYYNFFLENFIIAFSFFGYEIKGNSLNIILPVGISFYTFQTMSYTIDVFKRKLEPTKDFITFSAYVSFFPQLVAGPIERATNLLPQFYRKRIFDYSLAVDGMRQILWGLFKKVVIADKCGEYANLIFNNSNEYSGSTLLLGAVLFSFQIYGDFSGYSDIAIGTSRLFGFNLMRNFNFPYFSRDIAEFWRRWHISLSTWFRDYLYIPLGGSQGNTYTKIMNTFIIFIVSGLWHGANWTFVIWGALNAVYFLPLLLTNRNRIYLETVGLNNILPTFKEFISIVVTFILTTFAWIFFRARDITHASSYISELFSSSLFTIPEILPKYTLLLLSFFILIEWFGRENEFAIQNLCLKSNQTLRYLIYYGIAIVIIWTYFNSNDEQQFIYFQF